MAAVKPDICKPLSCMPCSNYTRFFLAEGTCNSLPHSVSGRKWEKDRFPTQASWSRQRLVSWIISRLLSELSHHVFEGEVEANAGGGIERLAHHHISSRAHNH